MAPTNLTELLQLAAKQEQEKVANEIASAQEKLVTFAYDKAATYTTVIIFGGYAGYFAIWQLSKDYLSKQQALWTALLVLVSLLSFVLFEVTKMVLLTRQFHAKARALRLPENRTNPQRILQVLRELEAAQSGGLGRFLFFWGLSVFVSVACALAGASVLGYAFICGLAR